jgi:hypothetical protein
MPNFSALCEQLKLGEEVFAAKFLPQHRNKLALLIDFRVFGVGTFGGCFSKKTGSGYRALQLKLN